MVEGVTLYVKRRVRLVTFVYVPVTSIEEISTVANWAYMAAISFVHLLWYQAEQQINGVMTVITTCTC